MTSYSYDPWGNITNISGSNTTIANLNPFRYRGYYYDSETGLYYLQSRYYDPMVGRFINADGTEYLGLDGTLLSYNLFAYCKNNSLMGYDPTGKFGLFTAIVVTGSIVGGLLGAFSAVATGENVLEGAIEGCLTGALGATCGLFFSNPLVAGAVATVGGAVIDVGTQATTQYLSTQKINIKKIDPWRAAKVGLQTGTGAIIPALGNATGNAVDAFATALIWAESSTIITCTDIVVTNTIKSIRASRTDDSANWRKMPIRQRELLLM